MAIDRLALFLEEITGLKPAVKKDAKNRIYEFDIGFIKRYRMTFTTYHYKRALEMTKQHYSNNPNAMSIGPETTISTLMPGERFVLECSVKNNIKSDGFILLSKHDASKYPAYFYVSYSDRIKLYSTEDETMKVCLVLKD